MRAQMKMFETIAVLVVFFFLLAAFSVFYFKIQGSSIEQDKLEYGENLALQTALRALYFAELDCSFLLSHKDNCFDVLKLDAVSQIMQNESLRYFEDFGYSAIYVGEIDADARSWLLYKQVPASFTIERTTHSPVLLYDARDESYSFGVVEVRSYD